MKFRFCGDQDCPEWILQEMAILSKLSSVRVRLLAKQLILNILDPTTNPLLYDKLQMYSTSTRVSFTDDDVKAVMNTLYFVLFNATRHNIPADILYPELEQLGLPSDIARSLTKMFVSYYTKLCAVLSAQTLKLNSLSSIQWRINYILDSSVNGTNLSHIKKDNDPVVEARIVLDIAQNLNKNKFETLIFDSSLQSLDLLLHELKECKNIVNQINK